ncbi:prepilin peptidase-dependent pilin [Erwinia rhapontici]|uniref:prepilin peptidase-dependent pilin n=1 Tax=Erwinia rhapontici TaxID=55212 RepID=UPI00106196E8|nr:prepilin peptidase-dependent pilin [Erwinia rhapontici]NKG29021.1 prepilin peptidase-dependent pilin [Erwinia rhapontici]TDT00411.1 prepilin peptidase dependent protein D [Erwinia rhapontici]
MNYQEGFTLIELMIVIAIIAILSAIGLPAYQGYLQKAALTDMLQTAMPYKTAVELCAIERGSSGNCSAGSNGVPAERTSRYVSALTTNAGVITLTGQESLKGLSVKLSPQWNSNDGQLSWQRSCSSTNSGLKDACQDVFRFDEDETP